MLLTWPLAIDLTSRLGALEGVGDPYLNLWILGWGLHAWVTDPLSVLTGRVFDANIFHPAQGALTFSDHFLLQALALSPVYAITRDAVLCYNLLVIVSIALSGLAMHAFARTVTGSMAAAFVAGLAWSMWPYRTAHLMHLQLQALYFLPLALLFLHRLVAGRRLADATTLGLIAALQAIASVYYGVMAALVLIVAAAVLAVATGQWRAKRLISRLALAGGVGMLAVLPIVVPYARSQQQHGFGRNLYEAANHAAAFRSYTQVPSANLMYGRTGWLSPRPTVPGERDRSGVEHQMFPGLVILVLAGIGAWFGWRSDARPHTAAAIALVLTGLVLSLGPEGARALYAALHGSMFGFDAIRAPARFAMIAMAGLVTLGAVGFAAVERKMSVASRPRGPWLALPLVLLVAEYANAPLPLAAAPSRETPSGQWLRSAALPGAVVHVPIGADVENTPFMVQSLEHWRPIVNGYSGQRPAFYSAVVESLTEFPSVDAYAMLRELDVRFVVSPGPVEDAGRAGSPLAQRASLPDGVIYEVVWTPEAEAALDAATLDPTPAPGPLPFRVGERLTYEVSWESGPLDLAAGSATLTAEHPEGIPGAPAGSARWVFEATAHTADWVSRFFEARDRFITVADETLRPIEHTRQILEGRRRFEQTYVFDADAGVVRAGPTRAAAAAAEAVSLPVPPDARDALTTFYYVRTLSLAAGAELTLPLNDGGRNMALQLRVVGYEALEHRGRAVRTLRLDPQIVRRVERRQPLALSVWLSDDERRVPLAIEVTAGFGRVRANLVDYRR